MQNTTNVPIVSYNSNKLTTRLLDTRIKYQASARITTHEAQDKLDFNMIRCLKTLHQYSEKPKLHRSAVRVQCPFPKGYNWVSKKQTGLRFHPRETPTGMRGPKARLTFRAIPSPLTHPSELIIKK